MELKTKLYLVNEKGEKFMGIGVLWLLQRTASFGSLRKAAADMTISYTKAYNMISKLEDELGLEVLARRKGGSSRDGAQLTPFGHYLVEAYNVFQEKAKEAVKAPYKEFEEDLEKKMEEYRNGRQTL